MEDTPACAQYMLELELAHVTGEETSSSPARQHLTTFIPSHSLHCCHNNCLQNLPINELYAMRFGYLELYLVNAITYLY
jgi:hypothetical protein